jgi:L-rhamnose mutarotase
MKRYCLTLELRNDPALIAEYVRQHYPHGRAEINESIRAAGIVDMQIYLLETRLFMIMDTADDFTFERKAELDRGNAAVQEWEGLMAKFQNVEAGSEFGGRWRVMERIYSLG